MIGKCRVGNHAGKLCGTKKGGCDPAPEEIHVLYAVREFQIFRRCGFEMTW